MTLADKIVVMNDGRIEQIGSPMELYNKPANIFVAGFLGSPAMNFLPAEYIGGQSGQTLGIRPEYLRIVKTGAVSGQVIHVEELGSDTNVVVEVGLDDPLAVRVFGQLDIMQGTEVFLDFDRKDSLLFDTNGQRIEHVVN